MLKEWAQETLGIGETLGTGDTEDTEDTSGPGHYHWEAK